jgi:hypothetical protein
MPEEKMSKHEFDRRSKLYERDDDPDDLGVIPVEHYPDGWEDVEDEDAGN